MEQYFELKYTLEIMSIKVFLFIIACVIIANIICWFYVKMNNYRNKQLKKMEKLWEQEEQECEDKEQ